MITRYLVAYIFSGELEEWFNQSIGYLAEEFGIEHLLNFSSIPHITLKGSLFNDDIYELSQVLESFAKSTSASKIRLSELGSFDDRVIFLKPELSDQTRQDYLKLLDKLKEITWLQWGDHDGPDRNLHMTLANKDIKNFDKVWEYLDSQPHEFNVEFDNVSILAERDGVWELVSRYDFNS